MAIKLKFNYSEDNFELYAKDIQKIVEEFSKRGFEITPEDACRAWEKYSESYCATWLAINHYGIDEEEFGYLLSYFVEE